jgi:hypothetical protein
VCNPRSNRPSRSGGGAGRDALPRDPRQHIRWSGPVYPPPMAACTPARPASHVRNASVDVRRRTRRNPYTIRGAAPEVNHLTSCRGSRGSASLPSHRHRLNRIVKPRGLFAETLSIRPRSGSNPRLPVQLTFILDSNEPGGYRCHPTGSSRYSRMTCNTFPTITSHIGSPACGFR